MVASLNGVTPGGWTGYALDMVAAGAAAIELNLYDVATEVTETGEDIERRQLQVVADVVDAVDIPVSVKLSPFYASVPNFVARLDSAGAAGVVLYNRFYQPDLDLESLDIDRHLVLSTPAELPLRLHALAILHGRTQLSLTASGGIHSGTDAAKAILSGADAVQVVSVLLEGGPSEPHAHRRRADGLDGRTGLPGHRRSKRCNGDGQRREPTRVGAPQLRPGPTQLVRVLADQPIGGFSRHAGCASRHGRGVYQGPRYVTVRSGRLLPCELASNY